MIVKMQGPAVTAMRKRGRGATRRKPTQGVGAPPEARPDASPGPARIPGVHIAHIGGQAAAVEPIRAYWQARGAVFMHHSFDPGEQRARLEEILGRSHIVFHAVAGAGLQLGRNLEKYCERAEKPLILVEDNSMWALAKALATGLPLT